MPPYCMAQAALKDCRCTRITVEHGLSAECSASLLEMMCGSKPSLAVRAIVPDAGPRKRGTRTDMFFLPLLM